MVHDVGILIGLLLHRLIYCHKSCNKVVQSKFSIDLLYKEFFLQGMDMDHISGILQVPVRRFNVPSQIVKFLDLVQRESIGRQGRDDVFKRVLGNRELQDTELQAVYIIGPSFQEIVLLFRTLYCTDIDFFHQNKRSPDIK